MDFINKKILGLFFTLIITGACSVQNKTNKSEKALKKEVFCQLIELEFLFDSLPSYWWSNDYQLFKNSDNDLEVFHLLVKSGTKSSTISQLTLTKNKSIRLIKASKEQRLDRIISDNKLTEYLKKESSIITYFSYFSNCLSFRSSPFYHTYLIKIKGKVVFKLHLDSVDLDNISEKTKSKAINAFNILAFLESHDN